MSDTRVGHLVSEELLKALDGLFPIQNPSNDDTERAIFRRAGCRDVIDFLREQYDSRLATATSGD